MSRRRATIQSYWADHVVPQGIEVISISSHTHKRGKRFWVEAPDGTQIDESLFCSDPVEQQCDPPLQFDSSDPTDRTLRFCATYDNGVEDDGSPDPSTVTRLSRMPDRASCQPVACTAGKVGAACSCAAADASCDSSPGAGDGECKRARSARASPPRTRCSSSCRRTCGRRVIRAGACGVSCVGAARVRALARALRMRLAKGHLRMVSFRGGGQPSCA